MEKQVCSKLLLKWNKHNFASICFFSFKIKQQDLIVQKCKQVKRVLVQFITVSLLTSDPVDSFLQVYYFSLDNYFSQHHMLLMLTKVVVRLLIFCIFKYVMYVMLCLQKQSNNYAYETCRYLLILIAKNVTGSKFQQQKNANKQASKTNKYIYIYIYI